MRTYEVVLIVNTELDETALSALVEKVKTWIGDAGGSVAKVDPWGKRRLAFPIRKQRDGQYLLIEATMPPAFMGELDRNLRFLEPVMRYLITAV